MKKRNTFFKVTNEAGLASFNCGDYAAAKEHKDKTTKGEKEWGGYVDDEYKPYWKKVGEGMKIYEITETAVLVK